MSVNTTINKEQNLVLHTITEYLDMSLLVETISTTLKSDDYEPGMNALWHFHDIKKMKLSSEELMFVAEFATKSIDKNGKHYRLALVAEEDLAFGLSRVYEAWSSDRPVTINNFRKLESALKWIASA